MIKLCTELVTVSISVLTHTLIHKRLPTTENCSTRTHTYTHPLTYTHLSKQTPTYNDLSTYIHIPTQKLTCTNTSYISRLPTHTYLHKHLPTHTYTHLYTQTQCQLHTLVYTYAHLRRHLRTYLATHTLPTNSTCRPSRRAAENILTTTITLDLFQWVLIIRYYNRTCPPQGLPGFTARITIL